MCFLLSWFRGEPHCSQPTLPHMVHAKGFVLLCSHTCQSLGWLSIPRSLTWPKIVQYSFCRMFSPNLGMPHSLWYFPWALLVHPILAQPGLNESICGCVQSFSVQKTVCVSRSWGKGSGGVGIMPGPFLQGPLWGTREVPKLTIPLDWFPVLHLHYIPIRTSWGWWSLSPALASPPRILVLPGNHL